LVDEEDDDADGADKKDDEDSKKGDGTDKDGTTASQDSKSGDDEEQSMVRIHADEAGDEAEAAERSFSEQPLHSGRSGSQQIPLEDVELDEIVVNRSDSATASDTEAEEEDQDFVDELENELEGVEISSGEEEDSADQEAALLDSQLSRSSRPNSND
jgi:hypothetical protein